MGGKEEKDLVFHISWEPSERRGGADVEEELVYSRPVSGGVLVISRYSIQVEKCGSGSTFSEQKCNSLL